MNPRMLSTIVKAGSFFLLGLGLTLHGYGAFGRGVAGDPDRAEKQLRARRANQWVGPVFMIFAVIVFFREAPL